MATEMTEVIALKILQSLAGIAKEIEKREHARKVFLESTHGRFNLFTTLLDAHDEVRLHTRFLAHLLNPHAKHDCGGLFLDLFLGVVGHLDDLKAEQCRNLVNEYYTGGLGNIDIYMEFEQATVVIENKIYAGDQGRQLERYAEYANRSKKRWHIFYLTPEGHPPSENSLGSLTPEKIKNISYRNHILPWLELCLEKTYGIVNINQALQQYRMTINQLLGITLEANDMNEIKNALKRHPEIISHSGVIEEALQAIRKEEQDRIKIACSESLKGKSDWHEICLKPNNEVAHKFFSEQWGARRTTDLTVYCYNNGLFSLIAYDIETGRLKKAIDDIYGDGQWTPESNFFRREFFRPSDLKTVLLELQKVAEKL